MATTDPSTSLNRVEEPGMTFLTADDAREKLFNMILDQLATSSLFSNSTTAPTLFIVYAHDNEKEGSAYDGCVRKMITWLQKTHAQILSDQSPLPPLLPRFEGTDAIRNIVANQMCLLPPSTGSDGTSTRTSVDKVIVCGSEVLEKYCSKPYARSYIDEVVRICADGAEQSATSLESSVRQHVENEHGKSEFHHVLTEIAFLEVRNSTTEMHGMLPVELDQRTTNDAPMQYLPIFRSTDVKLKLKSTASRSSHKLFFKTLTQLFPEDRDFIEPFGKCYDSVSIALNLDDEKPVSRNEFDDVVMPNITEAYRYYWRLFCTVIKNGKLQAYTGKLSNSISWMLEDKDTSTQHAILKWLSAVSAPELDRRYHDPGTRRIDGTCDWIVQSQEFLHWYECEGSALLSLCGFMGMGKTYCASRVIDWLRDGLSWNKNDEAFAYFYCNRQDAARSDAKAILRNIIRQLATGPWKPEGLVGSTAVHKTVYGLWKQMKAAGISTTWTQWEACLSALIDTYPRTTIILDAVDECEAGQRDDLLTLLTGLASRSSQKSQVKIFLTTRPEKLILQHLDGHPAIRTQEGNGARDIATFVRTKIAKHSRWSKWPQEVREQIIDTVLKKSGDMFLFAALLLEDLLKCRTEPAIRARLQTIPKSPTEKYEDICQRATPEPEDRKVLDKVLRWVLCSACPLTTDELLFAISQDLESGGINSQRPKLDEELILEWTHNLLCLEVMDPAKPPVWRLMHQSEAEFLDGSTYCKSTLAQHEAGKVCLMILLDAFGGNFADIRNG
ncbi:hypothetical protein Daus18300_009832 [Diaporthe australafricana]|uniref:Nephrocystin 3-like N-terminal domain-containing protein n=1 Tax=Diaporthe australafricana TaxID=127596 RepID=A0ABR3WCT4_9PEZI